MYFLIICRVSIDPLAHINDFWDFIYERIGNYSVAIVDTSLNNLDDFFKDTESVKDR